MSSANPSYPELLTIKPLANPPKATVRVPGSKSITNRALVLAALTAKGMNCTLRGALRSEDTEVMIACLQKLGFQVDADWERPEPIITVSSEKGEIIPRQEAELFVANSGTTMRFLTAMLGLGHGHYRLDGVPRMRERPIEDLLQALRQLGVQARSERNNGCPPVLITANGLRGGYVRIKGHISSQFISGLLLAAPFAQGDTTLEVESDLVSWPYVAMTVEMMRRWSLKVEHKTR